MDKSEAVDVLTAAFDEDPKHSLPTNYVRMIVSGAVDMLYDKFETTLMDDHEMATFAAMNYGEGMAEQRKETDGAIRTLRRLYNAEWAMRLHEDDPVATKAHNDRVDEWRAATDATRQLLGLRPLYYTGPTNTEV